MALLGLASVVTSDRDRYRWSRVGNPKSGRAAACIGLSTTEGPGAASLAMAAITHMTKYGT